MIWPPACAKLRHPPLGTSRHVDTPGNPDLNNATVFVTSHVDLPPSASWYTVHCIKCWILDGLDPSGLRRQVPSWSRRSRSRKAVSPTERMYDGPQNGLGSPADWSPFSRLLQSGYMSDCTVICGDVEWATHKAILCSRNNWFRVALGGPFKVSLTPGATQALLSSTH